MAAVKAVILLALLPILAGCALDVPTATPTISAGVQKMSITVISPTISPADMCTVTAQALNVRACAGVDCLVVGWLHEGDQVQIIGRDATAAWLRLNIGWINGRYCEEVK